MDPYCQDHSYSTPSNYRIREKKANILRNSQRVRQQLTTDLSRHSYSELEQITGTKKHELRGISNSLAATKNSGPKLDETSDPLALTETIEEQDDISVPLPLIEPKQEQQDDILVPLALIETKQDISDPLTLTETKKEQQGDVTGPQAPKPAGGMAIHKQHTKIRVNGPAPLMLSKIKKPPNVENVDPILIRPVHKPVVKQQQKNCVYPLPQIDKTTLNNTFYVPSQITSSERQIRLMNIAKGKTETNSNKKPPVNHLLKKVKQKGNIIKNLRKIIKDLRKQANVINGIKSPALKSLIVTLAANQTCKPNGRRWPESVKAVAHNIYKTSSSATYNYISKVFQLPHANILRRCYPNFEKKERPPLVKQNHTEKENAISELLLKRIDKMTDDSVEDTRIPLNMKILIKGDRKVGKSCLLQRLQGGPFIEEYVPSEQTHITPIHWKHKNSNQKVQIEVWDVVDKRQCKKKSPLGLKLDNQTPLASEDDADTPMVAATSRGVYKEASGVILMMDVTEPRTFEYVVKELAQMPTELPVVILGNHCDMQHPRQVQPHRIDQLLKQAQLNRTGPVRYAESSMRNGFGLRLLHKFLSVPFLQLQRASLLEQLRRCQRDAEDMERELDDFQNSEEAHYNVFLEWLASKRRDETQREAAAEARLTSEQSRQSPDLHDEAGHPHVPSVAVAQSLKHMPKKRKAATTQSQENKKQYLYPELIQPNAPVCMETMPSGPERQHSGAEATAAGATFDDLNSDSMDTRNSFLGDSTVAAYQEQPYYDSYYSDTSNPDLDDSYSTNRVESTRSNVLPVHRNSNEGLNTEQKSSLTLSKTDYVKKGTYHKGVRDHTTSQSQPTLSMPSLDNELTLWDGNSSARRLPEGCESPNVAEKVERRTKKPKENAACNQKSSRTELKGPTRCVKKSSTQRDLPVPSDEYVFFEQYEF